MTRDFIIYALVAGIGISFITGPLGTFIVWRRMAFFGETLSHSVLTGVALGLMLNNHLWIGILGVPLVIALLFAKMTTNKYLTTDTWLAVISHGMLAIGLVALAFISNKPLELNSYLFGDILAINENDLLIIYTGVFVILGFLFYIWSPLLAMTINEELAAVEGVALTKIRIIFMLLVAITVGVSIKITGTLMLTAMLVIPPATARQISQTPEQMAFFATAISIFSVVMGIYGSLVLDTPTSASIVLTSLLAFIASLCISKQN